MTTLQELDRSLPSTPHIGKPLALLKFKSSHLISKSVFCPTKRIHENLLPPAVHSNSPNDAKSNSGLKFIFRENYF